MPNISVPQQQQCRLKGSLDDRKHFASVFKCSNTGLWPVVRLPLIEKVSKCPLTHVLYGASTYYYVSKITPIQPNLYNVLH